MTKRRGPLPFRVVALWTALASAVVLISAAELLRFDLVPSLPDALSAAVYAALVATLWTSLFVRWT